MASERMKQAAQKLIEANHLMKEEWDNDPKNNHLAAGCYKATNALVRIIDNEEGDRADYRYTFSRLIEAFVQFSKHCGIKASEALSIGGASVVDHM